MRATAKQLKGDAGLASDAGRGTVVEISVPVSMESLTVLAVEIQGLTFLIPFNAVRETLRASEKDLVPSATGRRSSWGIRPFPFNR